MKPGRMELFTKPDVPTYSWWAGHNSRESFNEAQEAHEPRMKRAKIQTGGEARVVGSNYGRS